MYVCVWEACHQNVLFLINKELIKKEEKDTNAEDKISSRKKYVQFLQIEP